jgi:hypothetical protein
LQFEQNESLRVDSSTALTGARSGRNDTTACPFEMALKTPQITGWKLVLQEEDRESVFQYGLTGFVARLPFAGLWGRSEALRCFGDTMATLTPERAAKPTLTLAHSTVEFR